MRAGYGLSWAMVALTWSAFCAGFCHARHQVALAAVSDMNALIAMVVLVGFACRLAKGEP